MTKIKDEQIKQTALSLIAAEVWSAALISAYETLAEKVREIEDKAEREKKVHVLVHDFEEAMRIIYDETDCQVARVNQLTG